MLNGWVAQWQKLGARGHGRGDVLTLTRRHPLHVNRRAVDAVLAGLPASSAWRVRAYMYSNHGAVRNCGRGAAQHRGPSRQTIVSTTHARPLSMPLQFMDVARIVSNVKGIFVPGLHVALEPMIFVRGSAV